MSKEIMDEKDAAIASEFKELTENYGLDQFSSGVLWQVFQYAFNAGCIFGKTEVLNEFEEVGKK